MKKVILLSFISVCLCFVHMLSLCVTAQSGMSLNGGDILVSEANTGTIKKISSDGTNSSVFISSIGNPRGIAKEANGNFVVVEVEGKLRRIYPDGSSNVFFTGLSTPSAIVVDTSGNLIVTEDQPPFRLLKISPDGSTFNIIAEGFKSEGVKIDQDGNYIVVQETGALFKVTPTGTTSLIIDGLARPTGVAIDSQGDYIVTEFDSGTLRRVKPDGSSSYIVGGLSWPNKVEVAANGDFIVSELSANRLRRVAANGSSSTIFFSGIQGPDHLYIQPNLAGKIQPTNANYTINEGVTNATITIARTDGADGEVSVDYTTSDGTATAGEDYAITTGTLTFGNGITSQNFTIPIIDDLLNETNETVTITLSNPSGGAVLGNLNTATLTIVDNDPLSALSINDVLVVEGNSATATAIFNITLSPASSQTVTVGVRTVDETATAPSDYTARLAQVSFPPGSTSRTATIQINGDTLVENDETFMVTLSNPTNAIIADGVGIGTILNDDNGGNNNPLSALSINDVLVVEGNSATATAIFNITLSPASSQTVTVGVRTVDETATAPSDYTARLAQVSFPPGSTSRTATIQINGDTLVENDETFMVTLSNPTNATISDGIGIGTILNDDNLPCSSIPNGLISWWPANNNTTDIINGNNATLQNGAGFTQGKVGQAFNFDGIDDFVFVGNPNNLNISTAITLSAWVNPSVAPTPGELYAIVTKWGQSALTDSYGIWLNNFNGNVRINGGIGVIGNADFGFRDGVIPIGEWSYVAMTYDSVTGINRLYINGTQVIERVRPGGITTSDLNVLIGKEDSFLPRFFKGAIDEIQIYNRALSTSEIQSIYNAGSAGTCQP